MRRLREAGELVTRIKSLENLFGLVARNSVAERQTLRNPVGVSRIDQLGSSQTTPTFRVLGLQQVPFASMAAHDLSPRGNLEPLGHRFLRFDAFGTSHNNNSSLLKRTRNIRSRSGSRKR